LLVEGEKQPAGRQPSLPSFAWLPTSLKLRWTGRSTGGSFGATGRRSQEKQAENPLSQALEHFQKMCSRRRQSAQIGLRKMVWRELTFAATELIELLSTFNNQPSTMTQPSTLNFQPILNPLTGC
jgi:hypothetical protein